ncbi:MAG: hypothetical protein KGY74_09445 [Candidatus Cloacimonetes bacterium]|nr:hypothetical protein [Candidatus Cloacimonadota bacterium]
MKELELLNFYHNYSFEDCTCYQLAEYKTELQELKKKSIKHNNNNMITACNTCLKKINSIIKDRKYDTIYRPMSLVDTERTNIKVLSQKNNENIQELIETYEKQLGELGYQYGFIINRIEKYFRNYSDIKITDENFIIKDSYKNFMAGFTGRDRKEISISLQKNKYSKVKLYKSDPDNPNITLYKEFPFLTTYVSGKINNRITNLKNHKNLDSLEIPIDVEIRINKQMYEGVFNVCQGLKLGDKYRNCMQSIADLPLMLRTGINSLKNDIEKMNIYEFNKLDNRMKSLLNCMKRFQYSDKLRILTEKIFEKYNIGKQNRKKDYFDFSIDEIMYECFPGLKKSKRDYLRLEVSLRVITYVLAKITNIYAQELLPKEKIIRIYLNN